MENTKIKQGDFIEIEFVGRVKDGEVFDTNIKKEAEKLNLKIESHPLVICVGQGMMLNSIDNFLKGKELGKYILELPPEKAFGERRKELIKIMPSSVFKKQTINPAPGMMFSFDGSLGRISTVSGGRIVVDFNNPLSGKTLIYDLTIKRKIEGIAEKINALQDFFFRKRFKFSIKDKKLIFQKQTEVVTLFKDKFKQILNLDVELESSDEKIAK